MTGSLWAAALLTLALSALLPFVIRPLLRRFAVMDVPVARSSHVRPTLRGGGVAPAIAILVGTLFLATDASGVSDRLLVVVAVASTAFAALGLVDDVRSLSSRSRAAVQVILAAVVCTVIVTLVDGPAWLYIAGPLAIAGYVNVANFMDGINTISGLHGVVAGASFVVTGSLADQPWLIGLGFCLAAAFLAFLPWNVLGQRMFLGDVGSYLLGGTIAVAAVAAVAVGVPFVAVLGPLIPYLIDTSSTLVRRVARGERWFEAHNTHVYQQMARRLGHVPTSLLVNFAALVCAAAGTLSFRGTSGTVSAVVVFVVVAVAYLALPRLGTRITDRKERSAHV